ncbi:MAG: DUF2061 domain-containing protein [Nitrososphaeraceae archaeon]|nr:DUF2061 domain-containing protein [Nitrososphaeraceae archaeon]
MLTIVLAAIIYAFTWSLVQTPGITVVFSVLATIVYYLYERIWIKITLT